MSCGIGYSSRRKHNWGDWYWIDTPRGPRMRRNCLRCSKHLYKKIVEKKA